MRIPNTAELSSTERAIPTRTDQFLRGIQGSFLHIPSCPASRVSCVPPGRERELAGVMNAKSYDTVLRDMGSFPSI